MEDRRIPLDKGTILHNKYKIKDLVSRAGGTCLVYKAHPILEDGTVVSQNPKIIKEFYPMTGILERLKDNRLISRYDFLNDYCRDEIETFISQTEFNNTIGYDKDEDGRYMEFQYMDTFLENGTGYIVCPAKKGSTLDQLLTSIRDNAGRHKKGFFDMISVMLSVMDIVDIQHEAGYLNLDLKPDNILISMRGSSVSASIFDFGSSLPLKEDELREMPIERVIMRISKSKDYSSKRLKNAFDLATEMNFTSNTAKKKEFVEAVNQLSEGDDIYSLCRIFQEMLTGKLGDDYREEILQLSWISEEEKDKIISILDEGLYEENEHKTKEFIKWLEQLRFPHTQKHKKLHSEEIVFDMNKARTFSECGPAGSVFKVRAIGNSEVVVDVNFEPTRTRKKIPDYAGVYYQKVPFIDIRDFEKIEFEACAIGDGLDTIQVEVKPEKFAWMHEIFVIKLTKDLKKYTISLEDFVYPETLGCMHEITFVVTPDHFTDEEMLEGGFAIRNLRIL